MASDNGQQGAGPEKFVFIIVGVCLLFYLGFKFNIDLFISIWRYIRIGIYYPFSFIPSWVPLLGPLEFDKVIEFLLSTPASKIVPETVLKIDAHFLAWVAGIPAFLSIRYGIKRWMSRGFGIQEYNMETLLKHNAVMFPHLRVFLDYNPSLDEPEYNRFTPETHKDSMSVFPLDFVIMKPPMGLERIAKKDASYNRPIWDGGEDYDDDLAERSFITQMGDRYTGIENLKEHERKAFDSMYGDQIMSVKLKEKYFRNAAIMVIKRKAVPRGIGYKKLMSVISSDIAEKRKKGRYTPKEYCKTVNVLQMVIEPKIDKAIKLAHAEYLMSQHAFSRCGLMRLLNYANTPKFQWLKAIDRTLYFCLHGRGNGTSSVESAGPDSHFLMERHIGKPISHPDVTLACEGLKEFILPKEDD